MRRGGVTAVQGRLTLRINVADGHDDPDLLSGRRRLATELHAGLSRQAVLLAGVARLARRDDVLPRMRAPARARDDVIDVLGRCGAVLTLERVADEHRTAGQAG